MCCLGNSFICVQAAWRLGSRRGVLAAVEGKADCSELCRVHGGQGNRKTYRWPAGNRVYEGRGRGAQLHHLALTAAAIKSSSLRWSAAKLSMPSLSFSTAILRAEGRGGRTAEREVGGGQKI